MPEGDTVFLAATRLNKALAGQRLVRTDFRFPTSATEDLSGHVIETVAPRGKHLFFRTDKGITLHTHFKLEGSWKLYRTGDPIGGWDEIRAVLATEPWTAIGYNLAMVDVVPTSREHELIAHLGPDPLGADWDHDEAVRRLRAHPDRELGDVLLDQRVICGWGNAYKNEICYLRGLSPWTKVRDVDDLDTLVDLGRRLLLANRTTGRWVTTGNLRRGRGQWVFERWHEPCRRCGTAIERARQNGDGYMRWTYWCPRCQKEKRAPSA